MVGIVWHFDALLLQKEARDGRRYSNDDIAQVFGVKPITVWRWRTGRGVRNIPVQRVADIAGWLGVGIEELVQIDKR
jgi:transcriptional regulator with XRE-family HTH domain